MAPNAAVKAFVEHYYSTFDTNRQGLENLYQDSSILKYQGQKFQGAQNIAAKLVSLPFQQYQHSIDSIDSDSIGDGIAGGMVVMVGGNFQHAGEQDAIKFGQMFHLLPTPQGSFYVQYDFRLNWPKDKLNTGVGLQD